MNNQLNICPHCDLRLTGDAEYCPIDGNKLKKLVDPLIGRVIAGRYLIKKRLAKGGMGMVYLSRHQFIERDVALKFLLPEVAKDKECRQRFLTEARIANQINHEHIIDITDFGQTDDGYVYIVMEYLQGHSLAAEISRGSLSPHRAFLIAIQIAQGLGRAHELGVIHRDIKPENIYLIRYKEKPDFVKILDFGVARFAQEIHITKHGRVLGTPEYMSPEQITGKEINHLSDLYSLGCVLFEMLTGRMPFEGSRSSRLVKQMTQPIPKPSSLSPSLPVSVDKIVAKLLNRNAKQRYQDTFHLIEDLQSTIIHLRRDSTPPSDYIHYPSNLSSIETIGMKIGQVEWLERIELFQQLMQETYPNGKGPNWLYRDLERIKEVIAEVPALSQELASAISIVTKQEEHDRETRLRIGNALDALARDESRISRQIERIRMNLCTAQADLNSAVSSVTEQIVDIPVQVSNEKPLSLQEARGVNQLIRSVKVLNEVKEAVKRLQKELDDKTDIQGDLRFQIEQLKGRLGTLNAVSSLKKDSSCYTTDKLESEVQARLNSVIPIAGKILSHFIEFPNLRPLLAPHINNSRNGAKED